MGDNETASIAKLKEALTLIKNYRIKILFDETKTAGRTRVGGYLLKYPKLLEMADFHVLGKGIANGFPLSVLLGKDPQTEFQVRGKNEALSLADFVKSSRLGGTHSKEQLSVHAALFVTRYMKANKGYERLANVCRKIARAFNAAFASAGVGGVVYARTIFDASLFELVFPCQKLVNDLVVRKRLQSFLLSEGLCVVEEHNSFVCLAHEALDFDQLKLSVCAAATKWKDEVLSFGKSYSFEDPTLVRIRDIMTEVLSRFSDLERELIKGGRSLEEKLDQATSMAMCQGLHEVLRLCCGCSKDSTTRDLNDCLRFLRHAEGVCRQFYTTNYHAGGAEMLVPWIPFYASAFNGIEFAIGTKAQIKIHVWPMKKYEEESPHAHRKSFMSYTLAGSYRNVIFQEVDATEEDACWYQFHKKEAGRPIREFVNEQGQPRALKRILSPFRAEHLLD